MYMYGPTAGSSLPGTTLTQGGAGTPNEGSRGLASNTKGPLRRKTCTPKTAMTPVVATIRLRRSSPRSRGPPSQSESYVWDKASVKLATGLRIRRPFRSSSCALFSSSLRCASREKERAPKFLSVKGQSQRVRVVDEHRAHRVQLFFFFSI